MTLFKYICAIVALIHLAVVFLMFLPTHVIAPQHSEAGRVVPEWIGRVVLAVDFLLIGTMFYGMQVRKPIYWRLIPILMTIYLLSGVIAPLWTAIRRGLPLLPFLSIVVFIFVAMAVFITWWRNQKSYFAAGAGS